MYPATWTTLNYGGFSGPAVADGKVFLSVLEADLDEIAKDERSEKDIYIRVGADPRVRAEEYGLLRDAVICFDARTGRTLWHYRSDGTFRNVPSSKAGRAGTCCVLGGRVVARGSGGLYAFDPGSGELLWRRRGRQGGVDFTTHGGSWSQDRSPVAIGGVLVIDSDESLVGVDPEKGDVRWRVPNAIGHNAVPAKVDIDGQTYVVSASRRYEPSEKDLKRGAKPSPERLVLIEPGSGRVVWESKVLGSMPGTLCVWGDIAVGNGVHELDDARKTTEQYRAAGVRLEATGAGKLWQSGDVAYDQSRCTPVAKDGCAYLDSRVTGFTALDMRTGQVLGRHPHIYRMSQGSHNWTWHIATNDRVLTSGVLMFSDARSGFELLPGRLSLDLAGGYTCPIKPAIADGRLFARLADRLVCYDLRRREGARARAVRIVCRDAVPGQAAGSETDVTVRVRVVGGRIVEAGARWPRVTGPERDKAAKWVGSWTSASAWRATGGEGLRASADSLTGRTTLRLGWHKERWRFDLEREGDGLRGTYARSVPPLTKPVRVRGVIDGKYAPPVGGVRRFDIYLREAGDNKG
ncbi:MAG: outer membrane protein assembly factor BamB family protein, partial [Planctomycetota bacterium]